MKLTRNYINNVELNLILDTMKETVKMYDENGNYVGERLKTPFEKEIVKIGMLCQFVTDIDADSFEGCNDMYDAYMESDLKFETLKNYEAIDRLDKDEHLTENIIRDVITSLSEKFNNFDMNKLSENIDKLALYRDGSK